MSWRQPTLYRQTPHLKSIEWSAIVMRAPMKWDFSYSEGEEEITQIEKGIGWVFLIRAYFVKDLTLIRQHQANLLQEISIYLSFYLKSSSTWQVCLMTLFFIFHRTRFLQNYFDKNHNNFYIYIKYFFPFDLWSNPVKVSADLAVSSKQRRKLFLILISNIVAIVFSPSSLNDAHGNIRP